ncbi:hypothetical protein IID23_02670 [Patescibacteria group bacterium]|nr:hypothetical protein [Patescibacteria group bacterium]
MSKKVVKQFEEQFGKEWRCQCKADFRPGNLEILSESVNSLLAHYRCPECGREQMLAAAISESEEAIEPITKQVTVIKLPKTTISADDILDIKLAVGKMKFSSIRSMGNQKSKRKPTVTISKVTSSKN